ncbi:hypothetical protein Tco_0483583 [Tanacetum coccineum]
MAATRYKGKRDSPDQSLPPCMPESSSEEDIDPEQAQRNKDMQKNLVSLQMLLKTAMKFGPIAKDAETQNGIRDHPRRHKENIDAMCKPAEKSVQLQASNLTWQAATDEENDERKSEAHIHSYRSAKIQEFPCRPNTVTLMPIGTLTY